MTLRHELAAVVCQERRRWGGEGQPLREEMRVCVREGLAVHSL